MKPEEWTIMQHCLKPKTMEEADWRSIHRDHLENWKSFEKVYNDVQPPSYRLFMLVCPCGAILQCMEESEGVK